MAEAVSGDAGKLRTLFDELNSLETIEELIASGQRESETLEYKDASKRLSGDALNEVAKDVSAFANSLGGVIVYGVETDKDQPSLPVRRVAIDPKNIGIIQRAIASNIRHPIAGIRYKELPTSGTPEAFVVDIPQSALAPHQSVVRHIYYRRNGPHSDPMAHDLIELYFGRRLGPVLTAISGELVHTKDWPPGEAIGEYAARIGVRNDGQGTAHDVELFAFIPKSPLFGTGLTSSNVHAANHRRGRVYRYAGPSVRLHPERREWMLDFNISPQADAIENPNCPIAYVDLFAQGAKHVQATFYLVHGPRGTGTLVLEARPTDASVEYPAWPLDS